MSDNNRLLHESDELIEMFCRELERLMPQVTQEALPRRRARSWSTQTAQLERFNSEFAFSIAEALDAKLQKALQRCNEADSR